MESLSLTDLKDVTDRWDAITKKGKLYALEIVNHPTFSGFLTETTEVANSKIMFIRVYTNRKDAVKYSEIVKTHTGADTKIVFAKVEKILGVIKERQKVNLTKRRKADMMISLSKIDSDGDPVGVDILWSNFLPTN